MELSCLKRWFEICAHYIPARCSCLYNKMVTLAGITCRPERTRARPGTAKTHETNGQETNEYLTHNLDTQVDTLAGTFAVVSVCLYRNNSAFYTLHTPWYVSVEG